MLPNQDQALSALRTLLAYGAGIAVAHGWLTETQSTQLFGIGAIFVPLIWGMVSQTNAAKVLKAALVPGVAHVAVKPTADVALTSLASDSSQPKITTGVEK